MKKNANEKSLRDLFYDNAEMIEKSFASMSKAVIAYSQENAEDKEKFSNETIALEKAHDRIKEETINRLFTNESMVFSRADRLLLIESVDAIIDEVEIVVRKMMQYNPKLPDQFDKPLKIMAENAAKIGENMNQLIRAILVDFSKGKQYVDKVNSLRREIRNEQWQILKLNYDLKPDYLEFNYFQNLFKAITRAADIAEEVADKIEGLLCKYAL
jgi:uncharacterized protein